MTYVCTEKATINEWLKEIEELKKENKRLEELLTKWKDRRIEILIKENRELRAENKKLKEELAEQMDGWNGLRDEIEYWKRKYKEIEESYIMSEKAADARIEQLEKELNFYKPNNK